MPVLRGIPLFFSRGKRLPVHVPNSGIIRRIAVHNPETADFLKIIALVCIFPGQYAVLFGCKMVAAIDICNAPYHRVTFPCSNG
ncbi:MAG: hypothetical protein HZA03_01115 [Nitrospinae bacterium]|nr:hypothetical protein [Nitrospinota bacterium]